MANTMPHYKRRSFLKLIELAVTILIIIFECRASGFYKPIIMFSSGGAFGYLIISSGLLFAVLLEKPVDRRIDMFFSAAGCILFIIAAFTSLDNVNDVDQVIKGSFCAFQTVMLFVDMIITYRAED